MIENQILKSCVTHTLRQPQQPLQNSKKGASWHSPLLVTFQTAPRPHPTGLVTPPPLSEGGAANGAEGRVSPFSATACNQLISPRPGAPQRPSNFKQPWCLGALRSAWLPFKSASIGFLSFFVFTALITLRRMNYLSSRCQFPWEDFYS